MHLKMGHACKHRFSNDLIVNNTGTKDLNEDSLLDFSHHCDVRDVSFPDSLNRIPDGSDWNFGYLFHRKLQAEWKACKTMNGELQSQNNKMHDQLRFLVRLANFILNYSTYIRLTLMLAANREIPLVYGSQRSYTILLAKIFVTN